MVDTDYISCYQYFIYYLSVKNLNIYKLFIKFWVYIYIYVCVCVLYVNINMCMYHIILQKLNILNIYIYI